MSADESAGRGPFAHAIEEVQRLGCRFTLHGYLRASATCPNDPSHTIQITGIGGSDGLVQLVCSSGCTTEQIRMKLGLAPDDVIDADTTTTTTADTLRPLMLDGATFVLDAPTETPAIWGERSSVAWSQGEALIITGASGTGKTTIAGQLTRGRLGLETSCLDLPIVAGSKCVLYLAMDRPSQVRRALARTFSPADRDTLADRLVVWQGPPPHDLAKDPAVLAEMCRQANADTVIVDSLKDAAIGLSDDEVGAGWNRARQTALVEGVEVLELHHNTKRATEGIDDVYGSTWITAGAGSVIGLIGAPGDPIVGLRHLKQPVDEIGPYQLIHDSLTGRTTIWHNVDLARLVVLAGRNGLNARTAAAALFDVSAPTPAQVEKARRRLEKLVAYGLASRDDTSSTIVYRPPVDSLDSLTNGLTLGFSSEASRGPNDLTPGVVPRRSEPHEHPHAPHAEGPHVFPPSLEGGNGVRPAEQAPNRNDTTKPDDPRSKPNTTSRPDPEPGEDPGLAAAIAVVETEAGATVISSGAPS